MARASDIDLTKQYDVLANKDCEECKGTGLVETEGVILGRARYDKAAGGLVTPYYGDGNWQQTQCPCVGENND